MHSLLSIPATCALVALASCVATTPEVERRSATCIVRAPGAVEATAVLELAQRQAARILELYGPDGLTLDPDHPLSIWLQDEPAQPGLGLRSHADAEGFYAHKHHRIHLLHPRRQQGLCASKVVPVVVTSSTSTTLASRNICKCTGLTMKALSRLCNLS